MNESDEKHVFGFSEFLTLTEGDVVGGIVMDVQKSEGAWLLPVSPTWIIEVKLETGEEVAFGIYEKNIPGGVTQEGQTPALLPGTTFKARVSAGLAPPEKPGSWESAKTVAYLADVETTGFDKEFSESIKQGCSTEQVVETSPPEERTGWRSWLGL